MISQVLIIDDDAVDREAVRRSLVDPRKKTDVHTAESGAEGLKLLRGAAFDCVFLDYHLPDMDGISLLREIYDPETGLTPAPVIMLTGQGSEAVMADALRWGAQDYIMKDNISRDTLRIVMAKASELYQLKKSRAVAEEQLRQSQKMEAIGQLTSGVAHDFNNLLTVILGNTRMLQRRLQGEKPDTADLLKKIQAVEASAQRGAELVRRLMIFTRQRTPTAEIVDVNACVRETGELLTRALGELVEMKMTFCADIWPARLDIGQFENALINLAVNARDAMPRGGKLTLETANVVVEPDYAATHPDATEGPHILIAISDTGCGMPPSVARRVFEPFFTTKPSGQGTGLGLSMVYGFIRQCGGHISVTSELNHGTVFRLYLPKCGEGEISMPENREKGETAHG